MKEKLEVLDKLKEKIEGRMASSEEEDEHADDSSGYLLGMMEGYRIALWEIDRMRSHLIDEELKKILGI